MAKKAKFDFKQVMTEKGEKIGFYAAAGLLVIFLAFGGYVASKAASPSGIVRDMEAKVATVQQKTVSGPSEPAPIDPVVYVGAKTPVIPFTAHVTPNSFFNIASDAHMKRDKPRILALAEAQAQFIRGSVAALDLIEVDGVPHIGILQQKAAAQNNQRKIHEILIRQRQQAQRPGAAPRGAPGVPAPPPPAGGGGPRGGRGLGEGVAGGGGGAQNTRSNENEVIYVKLDAKELGTAKLAENIVPKRMVVINGAIPYKRQLEAYAAALRARSPQELAANDLPLYRGFNVQRQKWSADGKNLIDDWTEFDHKETFLPLYRVTMEFETDAFAGDPSLGQFYPRLIPDPAAQLVMPRPKLKRGEYDPINLPLVETALKTLKELGGNSEQLKNPVEKKLNVDNIFDPSGMKNDGTVQGGGGGAGMGFDAPGFKPPGARGAPRAPGAPGAPGNAGPAVPEDAWLLRFIDVTVEPGFAYRYRIEVKVLNPNYRRNEKELTMPKFAEDEELRSPWFELPDTVFVPRDEYMYAASRDDRGRRVTERLVQENPDVTFLQIQRWADFVRPTGLPRPEPIGDWLVADIKAHRGQYVGEAPKVKLPLWSLIAGSFIFRDPPRGNAPVSMFVQRPRADGMWHVDFSPMPQMLLVDFEGGTGTYNANRKQVIDQAEVDMLMIGDDGKVTVRRSLIDIADVDRQKREETWKKWLEQVAADSEKFRVTNPTMNPGGVTMPGGGALPGGGANPGG